jgi:hypothetical protein
MSDDTPEHSTCTRGFACRDSNLKGLGKVRLLADGEVLDCLEEDAALCSFAMPFGRGCLCVCPRRKHITQILEM